ncbi:DUF6932 family protein [Pseudomarimonas arenosa]|uniref:Polymerase nucleotidyl transferase domain-containing protein n=1 Tax=Pseudomarimonas arenosa TaxID=2774145 RepID=A0AAW3ZUQ5_9GAMM|nr:hypothetical protein [Pseudomarimonas arenosa]MBD8528037.1 hypothetical protein [Pseudomarimonas arenosa]
MVSLDATIVDFFGPGMAMNADPLHLALSLGLPPFPYPIAKCNALNATPYMTTVEHFEHLFGGTPQRSAMLGDLARLVERLKAANLEPVAALIGGSFLRSDNPAPKDLDCVLFYNGHTNDEAVEALHRLWEAFSRKRIDLRLISLQRDPLLALKACSFFSTLYGATRDQRRPATGSLLLDLRPTNPEGSHGDE